MYDFKSEREPIIQNIRNSLYYYPENQALPMQICNLLKVAYARTDEHMMNPDRL